MLSNSDGRELAALIQAEDFVSANVLVRSFLTQASERLVADLIMVFLLNRFAITAAFISDHPCACFGQRSARLAANIMLVHIEFRCAHLLGMRDVGRQKLEPDPIEKIS